MLDPKAFKAYDVRGLYPQELDEAGAYAIGRAFVERALDDLTRAVGVELVQQQNASPVAAAPLRVKLRLQFRSNCLAIERQNLAGHQIGNLGIGIIECRERWR